jgi:putative phosphoesterase
LRIAFVSDIHGNIPAFEPVLEELSREKLDKIICLGDVVFGPQPSEAIKLVKELGCPVIMGNWDYWTVNGVPPAPPGNRVMEMLTEIAEYWAGLLTDEDRAFIRTFDPTLRLEVDEEMSILCFHGSPRSFEDFLFATTPDDVLDEWFASTERTPLLLGGHTHLQMMRRWETSVIVNPGSVGQPFRDWWPKTIRNAHWAEYGIVNVGKGDLDIDLRRTTYDVERLIRICRDSGMPHADWWVDSWSPEAAEPMPPEESTQPPGPREQQARGRKRSRATTA